MSQAPDKSRRPLVPCARCSWDSISGFREDCKILAASDSYSSSRRFRVEVLTITDAAAAIVRRFKARKLQGRRKRIPTRARAALSLASFAEYPRGLLRCLAEAFAFGVALRLDRRSESRDVVVLINGENRHSSSLVFTRFPCSRHSSLWFRAEASDRRALRLHVDAQL
jgi:hypothetical protein